MFTTSIDDFVVNQSTTGKDFPSAMQESLSFPEFCLQTQDGDNDEDDIKFAKSEREKQPKTYDSFNDYLSMLSIKQSLNTDHLNLTLQEQLEEDYQEQLLGVEVNVQEPARERSNPINQVKDAFR